MRYVKHLWPVLTLVVLLAVVFLSVRPEPKPALADQFMRALVERDYDGLVSSVCEGSPIQLAVLATGKEALDAAKEQGIQQRVESLGQAARQGGGQVRAYVLYRPGAEIGVLVYTQSSGCVENVE